MDKGRLLHRNRVLVLFAILLMLVFLGGMVAACGDDDNGLRDLLEEAAQDRDDADDADDEDADEARDDADDDDAGDDADVDIDTDDDGQTITITGEEGDQVIQVGGDAELPDDFPAGVIPHDAEVVEVVSYQESGVPTYLVAIETGAEAEETYDSFLDALDDEDFDIVNKMFVDGGDDEDSAIIIVATKDGATLNISGGGQESDGFTYALQFVMSE